MESQPSGVSYKSSDFHKIIKTARKDCHYINELRRITLMELERIAIQDQNIINLVRALMDLETRMKNPMGIMETALFNPHKLDPAGKPSRVPSISSDSEIHLMLGDMCPLVLVNPSTPADDILASNDKYFVVRFYAAHDFGTIEYITNKLVTNFRKIYPSSYPSRAACYVTYAAEDGIHLYGIIRFIHGGRYNISVRGSHIVTTIKSQTTKKITPHQHNIINVSVYRGRTFKTVKSTIEKVYAGMNERGLIVGSSLKDLLAPDDEA